MRLRTIFTSVCWHLSKKIAAAQAWYTPYEGPTLANQKIRKLGVFGRKFEGSYSQCYHYFDIYQRKMKQQCSDDVLVIKMN